MKVAVIGLFHFEYFFIPYWQNYYGGLFGFENLFVIGDLANDPAMKLFSEGHLIDYKQQHVGDHMEHVSIVLNLQRQLLNYFNVVIFAEADQFFIPDPDKYRDLNHYLEVDASDYIRVTGYNVNHDLDSEPRFNPFQRFLAQRSWWNRFNPEDKMTIIRKPVNSYSPGFHYSDPTVEPAADLFNFHLHQVDFNLCNTRRTIRSSSKNWHPSSGLGKAGSHVFVVDEELRDQWQKDFLVTNSRIPDKFKSLI